MFNEAKYKLTRLGLCLFYFYWLLIIVGGVGVGYGIFEMLAGVFHLSAMVSTPLWQIVLLIMMSGLMIKVFLRECLSLLGRDQLQKVSKSDEVVTEDNEQVKSNVVAFVKK